MEDGDTTYLDCELGGGGVFSVVDPCPADPWDGVLQLEAESNARQEWIHQP